jgi:hypothetical protein
VRAPRRGLRPAAGLLVLAVLFAPSPASSQEVSLTYLGTGGWLIRHGDASILTAPFFSNPGLVEVGVARLEVDTAAVDRHLPPVHDVPAILVGHAHYDHLMDVPYIARVHAPRARVYGSRTMVNLLRGDPELDPARLVAVEDEVGTHETPGEWFTTPDGRIRFMPLASEHAPHIMGIQLFHGNEETPRTRLPTRATEWLDGPTLAWLIDFLDEDGDVLFRVHYQDASSRPPHGFPPPDGIPVDAMIVCTAGSGAAEGYPEALVRALRPRAVLLGHWEDFFRPMSAPLRPVPGTDLDEFEDRLAKALPQGSVQLRPNPGETLQLSVRPTPPRP